MAYIGLDTNEYERSASPGGNPLPAGIYTGMITRVQLKDTKDKTGHYLEVEFGITTPEEYNNRKFWDRFNIVNKSQDAVRIAKEQLSDLGKAAGLATISEDTDLLNKEVTLILKVNPPKGGFEASNECEKYWPLGTTMAEHDAWKKSGRKNSPVQKAGWGQQKQAAPAQGLPAASQPKTTVKKPWGKK